MTLIVRGAQYLNELLADLSSQKSVSLLGNLPQGKVVQLCVVAAPASSCGKLHWILPSSEVSSERLDDRTKLCTYSKRKAETSPILVLKDSTIHSPIVKRDFDLPFASLLQAGKIGRLPAGQHI